MSRLLELVEGNVRGKLGLDSGGELASYFLEMKNSPRVDISRVLENQSEG